MPINDIKLYAILKHIILNQWNIICWISQDDIFVSTWIKLITLMSLNKNCTKGCLHNQKPKDAKEVPNWL